MELKGRLKLIALKTPPNNIVCDIGTDHAYIPIFLIKNNLFKKAIACDVRKGPVLAATNNVKKYGLEDNIEVRLGDGLEPIQEGEADVIIIAGMGGTLIKDILIAGFNKAKKAQAMILQPMSAIEEIREWLYKNGFEIFDEALVNEGDKIYNVISTKWTGKQRELPEINYYIGEKLIENKDPLLNKYIGNKVKQLNKVIEEMKDIDNDHSPIRAGYEKLCEDYRKILKDL